MVGWGGEDWMSDTRGRSCLRLAAAIQTGNGYDTALYKSEQRSPQNNGNSDGTVSGQLFYGGQN